VTSALGTEAKFACDFKLATRLTASKLSLVSTRYRGIADVGGGILNGSKGSVAGQKPSFLREYLTVARGHSRMPR
jgi:hypothetical protein